MDRFVYIAVSGAKQAQHALTVNNHNLANVNTPGFRQALAFAYSEPVSGPVFGSRTYVQVANESVDYSKGTLQYTGNEWDLAIKGDGFFVVQTPEGEEAYTRAGNFTLDQNGVLRTAQGLEVLGTSGPIIVPPAESVVIGVDGTITIRPLGSNPNALATLDRLRLVNPETKNMVRRPDGLFGIKAGAAAPVDPNVRVFSGMVETSNVNTVEALTRMIELTRHYETQVKMMSTASEIDRQANKLLAIG